LKSIQWTGGSFLGKWGSPGKFDSIKDLWEVVPVLIRELCQGDTLTFAGHSPFHARRPSPPPATPFWVFELDLRAGELRKHGLRIRIQEQRFQVLALLVGRPGDVITREELQKKLWPADNFVDFDCGLNKAIWGARPRFWLISGEQFFGVRQFGTLRACLTVFEELCVVGSSEPQFLE